MHFMQIIHPMYKLSAVTTQVAVIILLGLFLPMQGYGHTTSAAAEVYESPIPKYTTQDIKQRLGNLSCLLDMRYTPEVGRRIKEYTTSYRVAGERILGKVDLYFPLFEAEIRNRNLPDELKYVAVVESHLNPFAMSKSGAAGLWQFIPSTARNHGLVINDYMDERKNPEKATRAALDFLAELYATFGDWTLAIAAYNCGPGGVRKAMRRSGKKDYWDIRHHLPKETQKYVPRIIAAIYLMKYYDQHNLVPTLVDEDIKYTTSIYDGKGHKFDVLADKLGMTYSNLKTLNSQFTTNHFPMNDGEVALVIPQEKYELYLKHYDPQAYQMVQAEKRAESLEEKAIKLAQIKTLQPLARIKYERIRHKRVKKIYYTKFS